MTDPEKLAQRRLGYPKRAAQGTEEYGTAGGRQTAAERCLAIYKETTEEMDFSDPVETKPTLIQVVRQRLTAIRERYAARVARWWLWNVSHPIKMWFHFRFNREKALPDDTRAIAAMLREAFVENDIRDGDTPYSFPSDKGVFATDKPEPKDKPSPLDLIFNRKRLTGS